MKLQYSPHLKGFARNLRKASNLSEVLLWKELQGKKLGYQFLRQRPIGNYIVDFFCHALNLAIEIDGSTHLDKEKGDEKRQKVLESHGIHFLRFNDVDVKRSLESVTREIKEHIAKVTPL